MGSKSRIAKEIVPIIQSYIDDNNITVYVEPFVGGANVIDKIKCEIKIGNDSNKYLIALLKRVQQNLPLISNVSKDFYTKVKINKDNFDDWVVGNVGFLASYNGKFFGGYSGKVKTKNGTVRDYYSESCRNIKKQNLNNIIFINKDFTKVPIARPNVKTLIYCDPPYYNTTTYQLEFNHNVFWDYVRKMSVNNIVLVSEETAPDDFESIWEGNVTRTQDNASRKQATEKLFIYKNTKGQIHNDRKSKSNAP